MATTLDGQYETRPVAADAYPRTKRGRSLTFLTHTVRVTEGDDWIPLCGRVKADSLVYGDPHHDKTTDPPTCPACRRKDPRFR